MEIFHHTVIVAYRWIYSFMKMRMLRPNGEYTAREMFEIAVCKRCIELKVIVKTQLCVCHPRNIDFRLTLQINKRLIEDLE